MSVKTALFVAGAVAAGILLLRLHAESESTASSVFAQATPGAQLPVSPAPATTSSGATVDESALRYFAAQGDQRRLDAEIARLRALYPDWVPPTNLSAGPAPRGDAEIERYWQLFGEGKYSEVRSAIAERAARDAAWQPPKELLDKLDAAEASRRLVNASDAKQWATVLTIAMQSPGLLTCENVDALWRVAEAYIKTDRLERALDAYRYVLTRCNNAGERLATVQKASTLLPDSDLRELMKLERPGPDGKGEFDVLRNELARSRIGKAAQDPKLTVDPADLAIVERFARDGNSPDDALVVGYYHYSHGDPTRALDWFKRAMERDGGARAAEGYSLAHIALKRFAEAEAAAHPWRTATANNKKAYLTAVTALLSQTPPPKLEPEVVARAAAAVNESHDATAAQAMGWYAYNIGQIRTAGSWFDLALRWQPDLEPAAFGLAVVRQRLRDRAGLAAIVSAWAARSERIRDIGANRRPRTMPSEPADPTARPAPPLPRGNAATPGRQSVAPLDLRKSAVTAKWANEQARERFALDEGPVRRMPVADGEVVIEDDGPDAVPVRAPRRYAARGAGGCRATMPAMVVRELSPGAALARGWCLMELKRPVEAATAFEVAQQRGRGQVASDATYGRTLALLAAGLTADAAIAAAGGNLPAARRNELTASLTTQRALTAYREGRYQEALINLDERARILPEQTDLMVLRGWSYYNLGRYSDAEQVFNAVMRTGTNPDAARGLMAIKQKTGRLPE